MKTCQSYSLTDAKTANQKRTSAQWWINNREITGDCLISVALLNLGLISNGKAFRVREVYREKTKQGDSWVVTREAENNNWVLPVFLKTNLTLKSAEKIFIIEQWGTNLERVGATTNPPAKTENLKIFSLGDALDKSRNNNSGWPSRELGLVVLKYSFSYPPGAAPYMNCYGVTRHDKVARELGAAMLPSGSQKASSADNNVPCQPKKQ